MVVVCITAGKQDGVLAEIRDVLDEKLVKYRIITIVSPPEMEKALANVRLKDYAAVAVYGGDGTIIAALKLFGLKQLPVLILPGGTANVLAKFYGLPASHIECLELYANSTYVVERVDLATINGEPLVLDMHMGVWTEGIKSTSRKLKKKLGEAAYAWSALKKSRSAKLQTYEFALNNKDARTVHGYTFIVANQGNHNVLGVPLFPYNHAPGLVQLAIIKSFKIHRLLWWFVVRSFGKNVDSVVEVHRANKLLITTAPRSVLSDDDSRKISLPITIIGGELSARIIVPPAPTEVAPLVKAVRSIKLRLHRYGQRLRSFMRSHPSLRYSHVAPGLYLGGKYSGRSYSLFRSWGVTGIVSMRTTASPKPPEDIEVLSLPTRDWHPPTLKALKQGTDFIRRHIANGGSVYVHCQLGEGRGPTMAAAYLITKGFTVDEAITLLIKNRPVVQPNEQQRKRLAEWQEEYNKSKTN